MPKKECFPSNAIQPAGMLVASSLNFFGAIAAMIAVPSSRNNPFFYTAMVTSSIYMFSNAVKLCQEVNKERQEPLTTELREVAINTFVQREIARRDGDTERSMSQALDNFYGR